MPAMLKYYRLLFSVATASIIAIYLLKDDGFANDISSFFKAEEEVTKVFSWWQL
jgi:hypothetical protein